MLDVFKLKSIFHTPFFVFQTDFLLVLLRDMLAAYSELRVVLMSATVDVSLFCEYFGNCNVVEVYGRVYPVQGMLHFLIVFVLLLLLLLLL